MRLNTKIQKALLEFICLLYILLFVYVAVSKLIDFENFQVQLGQSPLLSAFAGWVSFGVPLFELLISGLLIFSKTRRIALYSAFVLMTMFTTYIFIILNFSDFVPCSCGGVLEKLGWIEHLLFNIVFILIALVGILMTYQEPSDNQIWFSKMLKEQLFLSLLFSVSVVVFLFFITEKRTLQKNNFVRYYPHHPITLVKQIDMEFNSYYIAGFQDGKIYLGNVTAPLSVTVIDSALKSKQNYIIQLPTTDLKFRSLRLIVKPPYFYFYDGTTPVVFKGKTSDWNATIWLYKKAYFSHLIPIDSSKVAIKTLSSSTLENILGTITINDTIAVNLSANLLEKQIDGVFDTDGMLVYNAVFNKLVYTYFYRNEFILTNTSLQLYSKGNTIDPITKAQLKLATLTKKNLTVLAEKPVTVNKNTATYGEYIFIQSGILGNYEPKEMWDLASIIDVYSIKDQRYLLSFYLSHKNNQAMNSFWIEGNRLVTISGQYLSVYQLKSAFFKN